MENIKLEKWDLVKLRNGRVGIVQYDIRTKGIYPFRYNESHGLEILLQKDCIAYHFETISLSDYKDFCCVRNGYKWPECDVVAVLKNAEKSQNIVKISKLDDGKDLVTGYYQHGEGYVSNYQIQWDWEESTSS